MSVAANIKQALEAIYAKGYGQRGRVERAEVDQYGVVRAFDAKGGLVMFCHVNVWNETRRALGCSTLDPEPVHVDGADELYGSCTISPFPGEKL